jgi:hypothetical protein
MSRAPTQVDASHPIMRTLSELYLSIFVLFYRITLWRDRMKYIAASIGTSIWASSARSCSMFSIPETISRSLSRSRGPTLLWPIGAGVVGVLG